MNKIKEYFADWSWKEKTWLAFVLDCTDGSLGNSERKPVYVSYDTDKQSEPGAWSKR